METNSLFPDMPEQPKEERIPRSLAGIPRTKTGSYKFNPMVVLHGNGPEGTRCKTCLHLRTKQSSKSYFKCRLRSDWQGCTPRSDHRVNWPACGQYTPLT
jgi:hypothetical protein